MLAAVRRHLNADWMNVVPDLTQPCEVYRKTQKCLSLVERFAAFPSQDKASE